MLFSIIFVIVNFSLRLFKTNKKKFYTHVIFMRVVLIEKTYVIELTSCKYFNYNKLYSYMISK